MAAEAESQPASDGDDEQSVASSSVNLTSLASALQKVLVLDLRPTQLAVGAQQVQEKANKIIKKELSHKPKKLEKWLRHHPIPVILGPAPPNETLTVPPLMYLIDHHHLAAALYSQGIEECYIQVAMDWRDKPWMDFWKAMEERGCVWTHDSEGQPLSMAAFLDQLPRDVRGLKDDPLRSVAALIRKQGAYDKVWVPFSEFRWANFLRLHVQIPPGSAPDDPHVLQMACVCAQMPQAAGLPGFKGTSQPNTQQEL